MNLLEFMMGLDISYYLDLKIMMLFIYDKIRYHISQRSGITYIIPHNLERIKNYYYDYLHLARNITIA